ncbi:MAG: tetratricopeptide repeat protein [Candidatus Hydrogenedentes bacterium]|nr:tetratricopeptide repeat protein [Candidatus Hydrogenedentota bacterium]
MRTLALAALVALTGCMSMAGPWSGERDAGLSPEAQAYNHYLAGVIHERNGRFELAAEEYRKAADRYPDSPGLLLELTQLYFGLQDYENARAVCSRALELRPDDASLWIVLGMIHQRLENYEEMGRAFTKAVALNPQDLLSYEALIVAEQKTNDMIGVIEVFEQLIELHPASAELRYQLGIRLARINDLANAQAMLEKARELKPSLADAAYALGVVYLAQGDAAKAAAEFQRFLEGEPTNINAQENLAGALTRLGRYDEAIAALEGILQGDEAEPVHYLARMYVLLRAERFAEVAAAAPPEGAPILATLLSALARQRLGEPYRLVLDALDEVEGDVDAECHGLLNDLLFLSGEEETANYLADRLTAVRDDGVRTKRVDLVLARALMALDRHEEAGAVLLSSLDEHGTDLWLHYGLAEVYEALDDVKGVEKHLKVCLELEPDNPDTMNFLGYMYAEAGIKLDQAERLLNRALSMDPGNGFYLDSLGWVYYKKGKARKAVELIRQAILAMESDDAILRAHLGDAYLLRGEVEKALAQWARALRLDPDIEGVRERIDRYQPAAKP